MMLKATVWQLGFKITILELVRSLEYAITSLICKLRDCFSLKRQIGNIQLDKMAFSTVISLVLPLQ